MSLVQLGVFLSAGAAERDGAASVRFFNGRLLTGEDLTREQEDQHRRQDRLGLAIGEGVVEGLGVTRVSMGSDTNVLSVEAGRAINRSGRVLVLSEPAQVQLVVQPTASAGRGAFGDCPASKGDEPTDACSGSFWTIDAAVQAIGAAFIVAGFAYPVEHPAPERARVAITPFSRHGFVGLQAGAEF